MYVLYRVRHFNCHSLLQYYCSKGVTVEMTHPVLCSEVVIWLTPHNPLNSPRGLFMTPYTENQKLFNEFWEWHIGIIDSYFLNNGDKYATSHWFYEQNNVCLDVDFLILSFAVRWWHQFQYFGNLMNFGVVRPNRIFG